MCQEQLCRGIRQTNVPLSNCKDGFFVEELKRRERKYNSCKGKQGLQFTFTTCINNSFPCEFVVEMLHTDVSFNLFARWVFLAIR